MDIGQWLRDLGLQAYEQVFRDNGVDLELLPKLTADDLKEIGVVAVGHRRKMLDAVAQLEVVLPGDLGVGHPTRAERRQVTIMFVDLVGSTALSRRIDPEELGEIIRLYQNTVAGEISRFEGHVAKFMGDGVLAYFGWPRANEDAAERGVRAGLAVADAVRRLPVVGQESLAARVGIATGLVVIGDLIGEGAAKEEAVTGETPNLAARLQNLADPGTVVIAESTKRLLGTLFDLSELGVAEVKGYPEPIVTWKVIGESRVESRFEALHGTELAPIVGRGEELELVLSRWRRIKTGGQVVLVLGEPGIGKSRLVVAIRERLESEDKKILSYACSPQHVNTALFPFTTQIERAARLRGDDSTELKLNRLERVLRDTAAAIPDDAIAQLADLLGIPTAGRYQLPPLSPLQTKALLFTTFLSQIEGLAGQNQVLMLLEDTHWLDPTSRELMDQIVDRVQRLPIMLIVTSRPQLSPPWVGLPQVTLLTLNRLPQEQIQSLIRRVTGGKALPAEVIEQILTRTEGVPLFTEELTKAVLESGILRETETEFVLESPLELLAIPATLHDSLMARLDRLGPAKETAQIAACIGREFTLDLLTAVVAIPLAELDAALDRLVDAGLLFRRGMPPHAAFSFKHALVRDAAYESLLRKHRQELHARIATAIEVNLPILIDTQPELVARHFGEAGLWDKAVKYWLEAGRRAAARSANVEAIAHFKMGLEAARQLPPGTPRSHCEISLQLALGASLMTTKGFASNDAEAAYLRAEELSRGINDNVDLFTALRGLGFVYHVRGRLPEAGRLADESVVLARAINDPNLLVEATFFKGSLEFHAGHFQSSLRWIDQSIERSGGKYYSEAFGFDLGAFCRAYASHSEFHLGHPDRALKLAEEGLALARAASHPFSIALALDYLAMLHQFRRDVGRALIVAEEAHALCAQNRFDYYRAWSALVRAWAIAEGGALDDGCAAYELALADFRATGSEIRLPHYLLQLAAIQRSANRPSNAFDCLVEAGAVAKKNCELWSDAELERERGEILLLAATPDHREEAAQAFRQAIKIASAQGAKLLELRAATSLARLLLADGNKEEARKQLGPLRLWFTEGDAIVDVSRAQTLLDALQ